MSFQEILDETREAARLSEHANSRSSVQSGDVMRALELDLRFKTGDRWAFPYAYKTAIHFNLSGVITIYYSTHIVTINGRNLATLHAGLVGHTVAEIQEQESEFADVPEGEPFVTAVTVQPIGRS